MTSLLTVAQMAAIKRMQAGDKLYFNSMKGNYYFRLFRATTTPRYPQGRCLKRGLSKLARMLPFTQSRWSSLPLASSGRLSR